MFVCVNYYCFVYCFNIFNWLGCIFVLVFWGIFCVGVKVFCCFCCGIFIGDFCVWVGVEGIFIFIGGLNGGILGFGDVVLGGKGGVFFILVFVEVLGGRKGGMLGGGVLGVEDGGKGGWKGGVLVVGGKVGNVLGGGGFG